MKKCVYFGNGKCFEKRYKCLLLSKWVFAIFLECQRLLPSSCSSLTFSSLVGFGFLLLRVGLGSIIAGLINEGGCDGGMVCAGVLQMFFSVLIVPLTSTIL